MNTVKRATIVLIAMAFGYRSDAFCSPIGDRGILEGHPMIGYNIGDSSIRGGKSDSCCECYNNTWTDGPLVELPDPSIQIHKSRRDFIQYTALSTVGITSFSTPARAETTINNDANSLLFDQSKNIIAAVHGPLPPFSTTRTYRNIVLSNGLKVVLVKDIRAQQSSVAMSILGAGQFAEPDEIPGLAHLMEHIVLSSTRGRGKPKAMERKARKFWRGGTKISQGTDTSTVTEEDFEDWLSENEGDSNGFTAPGYACFHFNSPHDVLPEALERFSRLFTLDEVESTLDNPNVIPREIGRVADELDRTSDASRAMYLLKNSINPDHPFARFSAGSKKTLLTIPAEEGIDVSSELLRFFRDHYLSSKATLVVVGKDDLSALDRWISPFSNVMSQKVGLPEKFDIAPSFPVPMLGYRDAPNNIPTQAISLRSKDDIQMDENYQTLCIEWPLSLIYDTTVNGGTKSLISTPALGFILTQIISRRGPGSLRLFLEKLGWVPKASSKGVPKITFPIDVSGFQVLRMEIGLTLDGFGNRSALVSAVFESIRKVIEKPLQLDLIKQYLSAGLLHGYLFAPRPADAITLSVDSLRFGVGGSNGIGNDEYNWYLMPSAEDEDAVARMRNVVTDTLYTMSDESIPLVSFRASPKAVFGNSGGIIDQKISTPPVFLPWQVEPVTGTRYFVENRASGASSYFRSLAWFALTFDSEELSPPYLNPLVPTRFRAPRPIIERQAAWRGSRYFYLEDADAYDGLVRTSANKLKLARAGTWREFPQTSGYEDSKWKLWSIPPRKVGGVNIGLPLPVRPPEPSIECSFVVQLLTSLPSTWTSRQLALANLWLLSFDDEILDLAELGATASIAYETSLNTSGLRISFRGVSQTLPSYVRRFCRRFVKYHDNILSGSTRIVDAARQRAISDASRSPKLNKSQKEQIIDTTNVASDRDVAKQGEFFLKCTSGGYLISQGDILPNESSKLLADLQGVFSDYGNADGFAVRPEIRALLYRPFWKPRSSSPCLLPGLSLISDCCGRIPR